MHYGLGHVIGEGKQNIIYGGCYLSAIIHKNQNLGSKSGKSDFSPCKNGPEGGN